MTKKQYSIFNSQLSIPKGSFRVITLGCKVNQYESAHLTEALTEAGWHRAPENGNADVTIINTCVVTKRAAYQSRQAVRRALRDNPTGVTAAIGCYAQVSPDELSLLEGLDLIIGNTMKARLPEILMQGLDANKPRKLSEAFQPELDFEYLPIKGFPDRTRAFLKIQDGCRSFCSYCIVPFARGPGRSLKPDRVISSLNTLASAGYKEVVLTGIHLGEYGTDLDPGTNLRCLLSRIGKEGLPLRIRLSSIEPNEIDRDMIDMMALEEWLCRHFHIPLQSGDDRVLRMMNRKYTSGEFKALVARIHDRVPLAAIGVDTMVGFPGEDRRAYENTRSVIHDLPISYLHVFPYSPREGTPAAGFPDQVQDRVIKERAQELRTLGQKKRVDFYRSCLGKAFLVLTEGWASKEKGMIKGFSDNYLPVRFQSAGLIKNEIVRVRVENLGENYVTGVLVE